MYAVNSILSSEHCAINHSFANFLCPVEGELIHGIAKYKMGLLNRIFHVSVEKRLKKADFQLIHFVYPVLFAVERPQILSLFPE